MKHLAIAVMALPMIAASVFGAIGETPRQFEPRRADYVHEAYGGYTMSWYGKQVTHNGWFKHGTAEGETFWFNDHHAMTENDFRFFLSPYRWCSAGQWNVNKNNSYKQLFHNGQLMYYVFYFPQTNELSIWSMRGWAMFSTVAQQQATPEPQATPYLTPAPAESPVPYHVYGDEPTPDPQSSPDLSSLAPAASSTPEPQATAPAQRDCTLDRN